MAQDDREQEADDEIPHQDKVIEVVAAALGLTAGTQHANITDASVAHALNAIFSDTEVEAALNALGTKINLILDVLEEFGLMAGA